MGVQGGEVVFQREEAAAWIYVSNSSATAADEETKVLVLRAQEKSRLASPELNLLNDFKLKQQDQGSIDTYWAMSFELTGVADCT